MINITWKTVAAFVLVVVHNCIPTRCIRGWYSNISSIGEIPQGPKLKGGSVKTPSIVFYYALLIRAARGCTVEHFERQLEHSYWRHLTRLSRSTNDGGTSLGIAPGKGALSVLRFLYCGSSSDGSMSLCALMLRPDCSHEREVRMQSMSSDRSSGRGFGLKSGTALCAHVRR